MASVSSLPSSSAYENAATNSSASNASSDPSNQPSATATDPLANQSTFLTLLVSQLKNQNPMSPMDGTTFVTQLAQFSDLEQNLAMRQDLDSISTKYAGTSSLTPSSTTTGGADSGSASVADSAAGTASTSPTTAKS